MKAKAGARARRQRKIRFEGSLHDTLYARKRNSALTPVSLLLRSCRTRQEEYRTASPYLLAKVGGSEGPSSLFLCCRD